MSKRAVVLVLAAVAVLSVFGAARGQEFTLATPTLTATEAEGSIMLSWSEVADATRYVLWVKDCETEWTRLGEGDLRSTQAAHNNPVDGRTYEYTVQALNDRGEESDWASRSQSRYLWFEETVNPIPSPQFKIVPQADHIQLVFTAVEEAAGYEAFVWYVGAGNEWLPVPEPDLATMTFAYTEVKAGVDYFFAMRSYSENRCGYSDWSASQWHTFGGEATATATATATSTATSTATPVPAATNTRRPRPANTATPTATAANTATPTVTPTPAPARPTLYANVRVTSGIVLRWEYAGQAAAYELQYTTDGTWQTIANPGAASSSYTHDNLTFDTLYRWRIRAKDSQGNATAWSNEVSRTLTDRPDPTTTP